MEVASADRRVAEALVLALYYWTLFVQPVASRFATGPDSRSVEQSRQLLEQEPHAAARARRPR